MLRRRSCLVLAALLLLPLSLSAAEFEEAEPVDDAVGSPLGKLGRGAANLFTGWLEFPKRIHETAQNSGATVTFTWGLLRGLGHGFVRTAAGAYEIVTFPFPAPPDYLPVIEPEYVFSEGASASDDHDF